MRYFLLLTPWSAVFAVGICIKQLLRFLGLWIEWSYRYHVVLLDIIEKGRAEK